MSQEQPQEQTLCPNCNGGNPPAAMRCMWCGFALKSEAANAPTHTQPAQTQQVVYAPTPASAPKRRGCSPVMIVVVVVLGLIVVAAIAASAGNRTTPGASTVSGTPLPAVEGPTYEQYKGDHETMTDAQWAAHIKTLSGNHITNWSGWVHDVVRENDNVYRIELDQDGPDEPFAVPDVYVQIPAADATQFNKGQQITYSGTIDHIDCAFGLCRVIVRQPAIQK